MLFYEDWWVEIMTELNLIKRAIQNIITETLLNMKKLIHMQFMEHVSDELEN